jgi:DNA topoisomerase-3
VTLDERQVSAVDARIEMDLRVGFAFTRLITNSLRPLGGPLAEKVLSYGEARSSHPLPLTSGFSQSS